MKIQIDNKWYQTLEANELQDYLKECRKVNKLAIPKIHKADNGIKYTVYEMLQQEGVKVSFEDIKNRLSISLGAKTVIRQKTPSFMLDRPTRIYQFCDCCNTETNFVDFGNKIACKKCGDTTELGLYSKVG